MTIREGQEPAMNTCTDAVDLATTGWELLICNPVYSSSLGKSLSSSSSSFIDSWFSHSASDPGEMGYVATWLVDRVETHWVLAVLCVAAQMSMDRLLPLGSCVNGHWWA